MASSYQTYTAETPIQAYREDFIHREAICAALANRYPELASIATEARAIAADIDARRAELDRAEDDLLRAKAVENAEKFDAIDVYATLRGIFGAYDKSQVFAFLPDAPSTLGRMTAKNFRERATATLANLRRLPDADTRYADLVTNLAREVAEFNVADDTEDEVRARLKSLRLGLLVYKGELAEVRDTQLGAIQTIVKERARVSLFTLPWRRRSSAKASAEEPDEPQPAEPAATDA